MYDDFYVIAVINNPMLYNSRIRLFNDFVIRMKNYNVKLMIVEAVYGDHPFQVTEAGNPMHVQLKTNSILWQKENLINIGISRLPSNWKYVAWIDADIDFTNPNWVKDTIHELQHFPVVQLFEDAIDLGPNHEIFNVYKSFASSYAKGIPYTGLPVSKSPEIQINKSINQIDKSDKSNNFSNKNILKDSIAFKYSNPSFKKSNYIWHSGYAWAATREAINGIGGLVDFAICGAGDHHMICAMIGEVSKSYPYNMNKHYKMMLQSFQERALKTLNKRISYVKGSIYHYWHGKKVDRKYKDRWQILLKNNFDPLVHIHKDSQGLYVLSPGNDSLRNDLYNYFKARNEDSVDIN